MPLITALTATTELEAVNTMLAAIGEAPITDLAAAQSLRDVEMATDRLRAATREVQTQPWKFNRRFNYDIAPANQMVYTDPAGNTMTLNVFTAPSNLAGFTPSILPGQLTPDVVLGPSVIYAPSGTMIFIDRVNNREGLVQSAYPTLKLDAWFYLNFEQMPETARRYTSVLAARRFITSVLGSQEIEGFSLKDESQALRLLVRDQGDTGKFNMLNNPAVRRALGGVPYYPGR